MNSAPSVRDAHDADAGVQRAPAMPIRLPDPALDLYVAQAPALVEAILDRMAATPRVAGALLPVDSPTEAASLLLDMRAGRLPSGGALRVVYSDEAQIEGLFRAECRVVSGRAVSGRAA